MQIFWGMEGGKPENPDRPDRCAHPEPCGEESGQLYCPETTKKEKYKKENSRERKILKRNTKKEKEKNGIPRNKYQESKRRQKCRRKEQRRRNKGEGTKEKGQRVPATQGVCRRCRRFGCRKAAGAVRHGRV